MDAEARAARERAIAAVVARPPRRRASRGLGLAAAVVAVGCVAALGYGWLSAPVGATTGAVVARARTTVRVPAGVVVAEAGATVRWRGARIDQEGGEAFYRLGPGVRVEIATPRATVVVGDEACLRVVVTATAVTITVDEGAIDLAGSRLAAGARVVR
jgi:hypothetical protein